MLHMAQSPDGSTIVSAAADETLRFWKCFGDAPVAQKVRLPADIVFFPIYQTLLHIQGYLIALTSLLPFLVYFHM